MCLLNETRLNFVIFLGTDQATDRKLAFFVCLNVKKAKLQIY